MNRDNNDDTLEDIQSYFDRWRELLDEFEKMINELEKTSKEDPKTHMSSKFHEKMAELINELESIRIYIFDNKDRFAVRLEKEYEKLVGRSLKLLERDSAIWKDVESWETMYR